MWVHVLALVGAFALTLGLIWLILTWVEKSVKRGQRIEELELDVKWMETAHRAWEDKVQALETKLIQNTDVINENAEAFNDLCDVVDNNAGVLDYRSHEFAKAGLDLIRGLESSDFSELKRLAKAAKKAAKKS